MPANDQERIEKFRGMLLPVDEGVGMIREALEKHGIDQNTLVLFFADNGPTSEAPSGNQRWRGHKGSVYEGGDTRSHSSPGGRDASSPGPRTPFRRSPWT